MNVILVLSVFWIGYGVVGLIGFQNIPAKYNDNTTVVVVELLEGWGTSLSVNNSFVDDTIDIDVSNLTDEQIQVIRTLISVME